MLKIIRTRIEKTNNITRSSYIWNSCNDILMSAQSPIILMVLTRVNGLKDAGIFSIAMAVASLTLHIGQYGLRRFQSSDIREQYTFAEYYALRYITCTLMMLTSLGYCIYGYFYNQYSAGKFIVIMMICSLKCIQAFSDVIHGRMQQKGRLDVASKCSSFRYIAEIISMVSVLLITGNLMIATIVSVLVSLGVLLPTSMNTARDYCHLKPAFRSKNLRQLFADGTPLFLSFFFNVYLTHASKYAIDTYLSDNIQAIYNLIFMPTFVVQIAANFIFNPVLTYYAQVWESGNIKKFTSLIRKQMLIVGGLAILALSGAMTVGIPVLSLLFKVDLSPYRKELCMVMAGGGMLAYSIFFNYVLTIVRLHKRLMICYGVAAGAAFILSGFFVKNYALFGAAVIYMIVMTILALMLGTIMFVKLIRDRG